MANKKTRKKRARPSSAVARVTARKLKEDGLPGPSGTRIRFATPGDAGSVGDLLKAAVDDLEGGQVVEALAEERCGTFLLDALDGTKLASLLVRAATGGELLRAVAAMSLPLVAQDRDGQPVGALLTVPSATIAEMADRLPGDAPYDLVSMLKYAKIKALAVHEDARGAGIGAALLKRCVQIYWQLDYHLLFGEFETERALGPYYARQGFSVLEPPQTIDIGTVLAGHPMHLGAHPGEALFYRWR
ncbi:GNAT family N-acetyltransferase [Streptomyces sp. ZSW22]|uniref:GNAT family N-acetyltransferase n=1 Tax=Streptomyces sp. ZSW22 TaxID=3055050 RepID=UPI0025AFBB23|nr:GNAT family N-acetyltransferase [Streptomyces sp. ZSW22]MDN3249741.1 GNAT family N-acetyltransferase [Streptomyces sp. ZSW22]